MAESTFSIEIDGMPEQTITVKTGIYVDAVAAIPALLGTTLPFSVKIWVPHLLPHYGPYHYRVERTTGESLVVIHDHLAWEKRHRGTASDD